MLWLARRKAITARVRRRADRPIGEPWRPRSPLDDGIGMTTDGRGGGRGGRQAAAQAGLSCLLVTALAGLLPFGLLITPSAAAAAGESPSIRSLQTATTTVRAASVDPAAYLPRYPNAAVLARGLAERFAQSGVNTIYVNAYNVKYGAYYVTSYRYNS